MDALLRFLGPDRRLRIADLGCGMGWLSHHLATLGHEVYAVDLVLDDALGLGAAGRYVRAGPFFERIWAELERPPFLPGSMDLLIANASLHYAADLRSTLRAQAEVLRPGGRLVVMNSPVHHDASSADRAERDAQSRLRALGASGGVASLYHHFVRNDFLAALTDALGPVEEVSFDPGRWFRWARRAKGIALRMELASFPILCATRRPDR